MGDYLHNAKRSRSINMNNMEFTHETKTVKTILNSGSRLVIPRFQREYCWDKRITREFYKDIVSRLDFTNKRIKELPYFIGTMLFLQKHGSSNDDDTENIDDVIEVVDGQQRLTTITIFLSALSARFEKESPVLAEKAFQYVKTTDDNDDSFPILTTKTSYPFYQNYIQTPVCERRAVKSEDLSDEDKAIKEAYDTFTAIMEGENLKKQIISICGLEDGALDAYSDKDVLVAIRDELLVATEVVVISTSDRESANMIFEILNGKGVHLANIDLIKNKLFEKIPDNGIVDNAEVLWKEIQNNLSQRNGDVGLATFYRHFWISKYKKVRSTQLYDSFKKCIIPSTKDRYMDFMEEMKKESKRYAIIVHPLLEDFQNRKEYAPIVQSMDVLSNWFSVDQSRIGLLALLDAKERNVITHKQLSKYVKMIEIFHFSYNSVCHLPANRFESIYSRFAISLRNADTQQAVLDSLSILSTGLNDLIPSSNNFIEEFSKLTFSSRGQWQTNMATKYSINVIAMAKDSKKLFEDDLTIEHIIPESYDSRSPLFASVTNIGNLIALEAGLNGRAADINSKDKLGIYRKSKYNWVSEFAQEYPHFEITDIPQRANKLARYVYDEIVKPQMRVN